MKRMFALLLALCLMCGSWAGAAAESGGGLTVFEFPFITLYMPILEGYEEEYEFNGRLRSDVFATVSGKVKLRYDWESGTSYGAEIKQQNIQVYARKYDKDILAEYGSIAAFANWESGVKSYGSIYMGDGREAICYTDINGYTCYKTCLGNVSLTIEVEKKNSSQWSDDIWNEEMINDVVIPIFCNAQLPEGPAAETTDAAAEVESAGTQELKIGNVTFQVPAELTAQELNNAMGLYLQQFVGADYVVQMLVFDYEEADASLQILKGADDQINNLFWCYRVFSALIGEDEEDIALFLCNNASRCEIEPYGQELLYYGAGELGLAAHYYRNMGCLVMVLSQDESIDGARCCEIALTIASTFRIDGVTEEEMAADAEAARIAAEEAAARAAAQKYIVIKNGTANIRTGPSSDYDRITTAKKGDVFPLMGEEGTWYMIEVNGQTAYVSKGLCEIKE